MSVIGYARVSSDDQALDNQLADLKAAGAERIFSETYTGKTQTGREELERCLESLQSGDVLIVTKLDRLARSMMDLTQIVSRLVKANVGFRCLHQSAVDTTSITGRLMLNILGAFAEFERELIAERRAEGIARAKLAGKYKGRKPKADADHARSLWRSGVRGDDLAEALGCSRSTAYRYVAGIGSREISP